MHQDVASGMKLVGYIRNQLLRFIGILFFHFPVK